MKLTFSPLHNEDGSPCYFRAGCLLSLGICMCVLAFVKDDAIPEETVAPVQEITSIAEEQERDAWSIFEEQDEARVSRLALRKQALHELQDSASYFVACGDINAGAFGNCRFHFSEEVQKAYMPKVEATVNVFSITLEAKGEQVKDGCARFTAKSDGTYLAYDRSGSLNGRCFAGTKLTLHSQHSTLREASAGMDEKKGPSVLAHSAQ